MVGITPTRSYLVCATQRSGSTLLCELLKATGVAGRPEEYFEAQPDTGIPPSPGAFLHGLAPTGAGIRADLTPPEAPSYSSLVGLPDYRAHLTRTLRAGSTANGVFGAKLMFNQIGDLQALAGGLPQYAGLDPVALLTALLHSPIYVWVSREDKVRQAVSMWTALQTRRWRGGRRSPPPGESAAASRPRYSFAGIDHLVRRFTAEDEGWERLFAAHGITPVRISYERDLERDRTTTVTAVLAAIGVHAPAGWTAPEPIARQADTRSAEWVAAYHRDVVSPSAA